MFNTVFTSTGITRKNELNHNCMLNIVCMYVCMYVGEF